MAGMGRGVVHGTVAALAVAGAMAALAAGRPGAQTADRTITPVSDHPTTGATTTGHSTTTQPTSTSGAVAGTEATDAASQTTLTTPSPVAEWHLVWADEFEHFDPSNWIAEQSTYGHGNAELQCYQPANVSVDDGLLRLRAEHAPTTCPRNEHRDYSSGMVRSAGLADWTYGRFEIRARLPAGDGLWPAAWLSPITNTYGAWPRSGEIDIVEALGHTDDRIVGSLHWMGPRGPRLANREFFLRPGESFTEDFHTFAVEWEPDRIVWFVDDQEYQRVESWPSALDTPSAPFDQPFYLKLNLAVGGVTAGEPDHVDGFPASYDIDWVRVYQR